MVGRQVIKTYTTGLLTVHCEQDKTFSSKMLKLQRLKAADVDGRSL